MEMENCYIVNLIQTKNDIFINNLSIQNKNKTNNNININYNIIKTIYQNDITGGNRKQFFFNFPSNYYFLSN